MRNHRKSVEHMKRFDYNYTVFRCKVWIEKNGNIRMNVEDEEEEYEIISTMFIGMWGVWMCNACISLLLTQWYCAMK